MSDRPGGFSTTDLDRMFLLQFAFTRIVEIHSLRDTATNLLDAYVGRAAGQRILAGEVKRGDGQTIEAVIWYCDLRGFTRASDRLPRDAIIALLNDYFDTMGGARHRRRRRDPEIHGRRHAGDLPGRLGRRADGDGGAGDRAARGGRCACSGAQPHARHGRGEPSVRFGLALHVGEVMFGNIGASQRLDFTVIGPAVNHAARLEKLCTPLDRRSCCRRRWPRCCPSAMSCRSAAMR